MFNQAKSSIDLTWLCGLKYWSASGAFCPFTSLRWIINLILNLVCDLPMYCIWQILESIRSISTDKVVENMICKSSHPEVFLEKPVLKICSKSTGEHQCQSVIPIKLLCKFIEITLRHECSPVNLPYIFRTSFTKNPSGWLLLDMFSAFKTLSVELACSISFPIFRNT